MPLYEYRCDACGERFEVIQKFSDPAPDACEKCGSGPVQRQLSSPAIQFKGTGWYITDYAQKGKTGGDSTTATKSGGSTTAEGGSSGSSDSAKSTDAASSSSTSSAPATTKD